MLHSKVLVSIAILIGSFSHPTIFGAEQTFAELHTAALSALEQHRLGEAEVLLQKALWRISEPSLTTVVLWNEIGRVHQEQGRLADAERDYRHALDVNSRLPLPDESQRAASLNDLAALAELQGRLKDAEQCFRGALEILHRIHSTDYSAEIKMLGNLGAVLEDEHRFRDAFEVFASATELAHLGNLENDLSYAHLLVHSGMLSFETGDYARAIEAYRHALEIETRNRNTPALDLANVHHNLGVVLFQIDRSSDSAAEERSAIDLLKRAGVSEGSVDTLNTLALAEARMGQIDVAQGHATQALLLALKRGSVTDPAVARARIAVGSVAKQRSDRKTARGEYETVLKDIPDKKGPEYASALTNLAELEDDAGRHKRAEELYSMVLRIDKANFGDQHPKVAADLCNLAKQKFFRKQLPEALDLYERAIEIEQVAFGTQSVEAARAWHGIAVVLEAMKRLDEAEPAYQKAIIAFRGASPESMEYAGCLREYGTLLRYRQHFAEAEKADLLAMNIEVKQAIRSEAPSANRPGASSFR